MERYSLAIVRDFIGLSHPWYDFTIVIKSDQWLPMGIVMVLLDASNIGPNFIIKRGIGASASPITNADSHRLLRRHRRLHARAEQRSQHQQRREARCRYSDIWYHIYHHLRSIH